VKFLRLNNDVEIPILGYGVFQIPPAETERCVLDALEVGYRLIDTAQAYRNEKQVGAALKSAGIARDELFITTKVWIGEYGYDTTKRAVEVALGKLQLDYLDLMLLHQPFNDIYGAWRALEDLYDQGLLRAIGVSNFYPDRLADLSEFNRITPQVNQVETNPFNQQIAAQQNMQKYGVQIESWAPFGEGKNGMFTHPTLQAIGQKHGKTVAQVILRWLIQREIVALPKTVSVERMRENFDVFDFTLDDQDMREIQLMDTGSTLFDFDHRTPEAVAMFFQRRNVD
jgi:diketogulonate reductase-like aldo/keto reductase